MQHHYLRQGAKPVARVYVIPLVLVRARAVAGVVMERALHRVQLVAARVVVITVLVARERAHLLVLAVVLALVRLLALMHVGVFAVVTVK